MSASGTMDSVSATNHNTTKRRGRKPKSAACAPCQDCIQRASLSGNKGNVRFCNDCARALGHSRLPERSVNVQSLESSQTHRAGITKPKRRATPAVAVAVASASSRPPVQTSIELTFGRLNTLPSRFADLTTAHALLRPVHERLASLVLTMEGQARQNSTVLSVDSYQLQCRPWLELWEIAFAKYLKSSITGMSVDQHKLAMTIKAQQLIAEIFAKVNLADGQPDWSMFGLKFEAVLHLATEVLEETHVGSAAQDIDSNDVSSVNLAKLHIQIHDPVYEVHIRTTDLWLREWASQLLCRINLQQFSLHSHSVAEDEMGHILHDDPFLASRSEPSMEEALYFEQEE